MATPLIAGIHLDLKYIMPEKTYLKGWVRELPKLGMNTLLIEYEDKFPFRKYPFLQHKDAFTPDELRELLDIARGVGLRVVPLVQTISHLEFALAHEQLAHLREAPHVPTQIDTSSDEAARFVRDLLDEVLAYHEQDDWFHIGADEAWYLGTNERTKRRMEELGQGKMGLWIEQVKKPIAWVMEAGKRPIVWDDIFWKEPEKIRDAGLPKELILMAWNYGVTDLGGTMDSGGQGSELGDTSGKLRQVDIYHDAGFDSIAAPCLNWGVLVPRHDHCLKNTSAWSQKVRRSGMLGTINTAWACFHVLPNAQNLHIAATAAMLNDPATPLTRKWQDQFLTDHFGTDATGAGDALEALAPTSGWSREGMERGITPVVYGYTDVYHWYGSQKRRTAEGGYPLDWNAIDFVKLFQFKMDELRKGNVNEGGEPAAKLRALKEGYESALPIMTRLAEKATRHKAEAVYYRIAAELKVLHTRIVLHMIADEGDRDELNRQWQAIEKPLRDALRPLFAPEGLEQTMRIWWEPTAKTLSSVQA